MPDGNNEQQTEIPSKGGSVLLKSVFAGVVVGTVANITALALARSIWLGLLSHSVFGALAMGLVLVRYSGREQAARQRKATETLSTEVGTARH